MFSWVGQLLGTAPSRKPKKHRGTRLSADRLRELAAQGKTRKQAAAEIGRSYSGVAAAAKRYGVAFPDTRGLNSHGPIDPSRTPAIVARRRSGATYEEIGKEYGITRERIRQILAKHAPDLIKMFREELGRSAQARYEFMMERKRARQYERWRKLRAAVEYRCDGNTWSSVAKFMGSSVVTPAGSHGWNRVHEMAKSLKVDISWLTNPKERRMLAWQESAPASPIPAGWIEENEARFKP